MAAEIIQPPFTHAELATLAAVAVAFMAAAGSWIATWRSNLNSREQLAKQLEHDSEERKQEREMSLRRDVYLPTVEALIRAQAALGKAIDPNADLRAIGEQLILDQAIMAKVHLVGSNETIAALMKYMNNLMPAYMELSAMQIPMAVRQRGIEAEQSIIDGAKTLQQQNIELMRQFNIAGKTDQSEWARINRQLEVEQAAISEHENRKAALWAEQNEEVRRGIARMSELAQRIAPLIPEAVIAARKDIDLPLDPDWYRKLFAAQKPIVSRSVQDFLDRTRPPSQP